MGPIFHKSILAFALAVGLLCIPGHAAQARQFQLSLPLDCAMGSQCFVQNYFDRIPGKGYADYACGTLSYDGHRGTDFRVLDLAAMERGVPVLAAADGVVIAVRDGMQDINVREIGKEAVAQRGMGNLVVLEHEGGYQTGYGHLRKNSIVVQKGDRVRSGQQLGLVGLSGLTEFPHLHLAVRKDGIEVDPFSPGPYAPCGSPVRPLWDTAARARLQYIKTGLLGMEFSNVFPDRDYYEQGGPGPTAFTYGKPVFVWVNIFGLQRGDTMVLTMVSEHGERIASKTWKAKTTKAAWKICVGKKNRKDPMPPGVYTGRVTLHRATPSGPKIVLDYSKNIRISK